MSTFAPPERPVVLAPPLHATLEPDSVDRERTAIVVGGWSLVVAAVAFVAVFSWLAAAFGYPDVLDGAADAVLPALLRLGPGGRAVWAVYALLPLLLIPAGVGASLALRRESPGGMRIAATLAGVAAVAMLLGLARWPSIHWSLASAWIATGSAAEHAAIAAVFDGLNAYLGNWIGEFVGELALNLFFVLTAVASFRSARMPRWSAWGGVVAGLLGLAGMWRNVTPLAAPFAAADNLVLPLWMLVLGLLLVRAGRRPARG
jgi:Domain of unknown function (DUF4386)